MPEPLDPRLSVQLRLALLGDCGCLKTLADLERDARVTGLTGAEIDAALAGGSFEVRAAAVIAYACTLRSGEPQQVEAARARAARLGVSGNELAAIATETRTLLKGHAQ